MERSEIKFPCWRCYNCGRLITRLEIAEAWEAKKNNLCPCGSGKISPTNPRLWEELFLPRVWKLWWSLRKNGVMEGKVEDQDAG